MNGFLEGRATQLTACLSVVSSYRTHPMAHTSLGETKGASQRDGADFKGRAIWIGVGKV